MQEKNLPKVNEYLFEVYSYNHEEYIPRFKKACKLYKNFYNFPIEIITRVPAVVATPQPQPLNLQLPEIFFCVEQDFLVLTGSEPSETGKIVIRNMDQTVYEKVRSTKVN